MKKGCNLIRNTRRDMYGDYKFRDIELKYGNGSKTDSFWCFSLLVWWEQASENFRVCATIPGQVLWYKKLFLHIDATFDGAPRGFYQVVIFSVMDHASSLHMSIFYCPMTKKSEEAYNLLWGNIVSIVGEFVWFEQCYIYNKW